MSAALAAFSLMKLILAHESRRAQAGGGESSQVFLALVYVTLALGKTVVEGWVCLACIVPFVAGGTCMVVACGCGICFRYEAVAVPPLH